eukprot:COSAG02_NODE_726_length_18005_cov_69.224897_17_plen_70_part_00
MRRKLVVGVFRSGGFEVRSLGVGNGRDALSRCRTAVPRRGESGVRAVQWIREWTVQLSAYRVYVVLQAI